MSLWHIAWSYLWSRKLTSSLTILSVALGVGLICAVMTLREETRKRFEEEGQAYDIVVGAKGSPLQLVLSSLYFIDMPTGNIPYSTYETLRDHEDVEAAFPIGLGDTFRGFRIVGTIPELFEHMWVNPATGEERAPFRLSEGRFFERPMEAVLGSVVARLTGLQVRKEGVSAAAGQDQLDYTFVGTHGFIELPGMEVHAHDPYTVVGILEPSGTPNDRAIFCNLDSVWQVHGHDEEDDARNGEEEREVTAVMLSLESPALRFVFEEYVNQDLNAMATIPVNQIRKLYDQLLGTAKTILLAIGYLVVVVSALSILIGLYLSILQRRRDLAIMRALGASAPEIFGAVLLEAFWVTVLGIGAGWLLGNVVSWGLGLYLSQRVGLMITAFSLTNEEIGAFAVVAIVGLLAGILPAWQAYRTDVARDLAEV